MKKTKQSSHLMRWLSSRYLYKASLMLIALLFCSNMIMYAATQKKVTVTYQNQSLHQVFDDLQQKSGYGILYQLDDVLTKGKISYRAKNVEVTDVLTEVLNGTEMAFKVQDDVIVVYKAMQNEKILKGKIVDMKKQPIPGANIVVADGAGGTISDTNGDFTLRVGADAGQIKVTFIGFKTKTINYKVGDFVLVTLAEEIENLDEVQVVAYGIQSRREVTGAIASVKADEIADVPVSNLASALQGKVAGVDITQISGAPGSSKVMTLVRGYNELQGDGNVNTGRDVSARGSSSPLWVVDGVPIDEMSSKDPSFNVLSELDPEMVESVEVLKDAASASLYGSRAANGVILVTTKAGKKGKSVMKVNLSQTLSWLPETPTIIAGNKARRLVWEMLRNSDMYYTHMNGDYGMYDNYYDSFKNSDGYLWRGYHDIFWGDQYGGGYSNPVLQDSLNTYYNNVTNYPKILFKTGRVTRANLTASGGSDKVTYSVGGGYYNERGIVNQTGFARGNILANLGWKASDKASFAFRTFVVYSEKDNAQTQERQDGDDETIPDWPYNTSPFFPGEGHPYLQTLMAEMTDKVQEDQSFGFRTTLGFNYQFNENLVFTSNNSFALNLKRRHFFIPSKYSNYDENSSSEIYNYDRFGLSENTLTYKFDINDTHNFEFLAGSSYQRNLSHSLKGFATNGPNDNIQYIIDDWPNIRQLPEDRGGLYESLQSTGSTKYESIIISFFGRVNYNYKKKYLFSFSARRDGSSKFGKAKPWGTFPAISAGWAFSEEPFMNAIPAIDFGKIRASYGITGKNYSREYLAYGLYNAGPTYQGNPTMYPTLLFAPDLTWEETKQLNIGLDMDFYNYKYGIIVDYYSKLSDKMLMTAFLPGDYTYINRENVNSGQLLNEGFEFTFKWNPIRNDKWNYKLQVNLSKNWNKFIESYNGKDYDPMIKGRAVRGVYALETVGVADKAEDVPFVYNADGSKKYLGDGLMTTFRVGDMIYVDQNNDGQISAADFIYKGSALPDIYGGLVHELSYKNFDLRCYLTYSLGRTVNTSALAQALDPKGMDLTRPLLLDPTDYKFWEKEGDGATAEYPRFNAGGSNMNYISQSDRFVQDLNYLKVKSITLGYTLPDNLVSKLRLGKVRAYVTAENVASFSNLEHKIDPEAVDINGGQYSLTTYPLATKCTLGLSVNF